MARFGKAAGMLIAITGMLMLGIGFLYDLLFAGIPYQDPPAALQHAYDIDAGIASTIYRIGGIILVIGILVTTAQILVRRRVLARRS